MLKITVINEPAPPSPWEHLRRCPICLEWFPFARRGRPRVTCSDKCRQRWFRRRNLKLRYHREDRATERRLRPYERLRGRVDETPIPGTRLNPRDLLLFMMRHNMKFEFCAWCGKPFVRVMMAPGSLRHCCSRKCVIAYAKYRHRLDDAFYWWKGLIHPFVFMNLRTHRVRDYKARLSPIRNLVGLCRHCGKPFAVFNVQQRYCSKRCRQAKWYRRHHPPKRAIRRTCLACGKRFEVRHFWQKVCDADCRRRWRSTSRSPASWTRRRARSSFAS